jgi:hypothetical protein
LVYSVQLFPQVDCRTILGSNLRSISDGPFSWGLELSGSLGAMADRKIANGQIYAGLDFSKSHHQFYFEVAYKNWYNSAKNPDGEDPGTSFTDFNRPKPSNLGFRELFYQYKNQSDFLKFGVQTYKTPDNFILNERILGISGNKSLGNFIATGALGTVTNKISRFGDVCGNRHIYNILHRSQFNFTGDKPGATNFGTLFLNWKRGSATKKSSTPENKNDEFSEFGQFDEFSVTSDDSKTEKKSIIRAEKAGIFFYEEFGSGFHEYKYYTGGFAEFETVKQSVLELQLIDQYILNDHALAYRIKLEKDHFWKKGSNTKFALSFLSKINIDKDAHFYPAFSNLFLGEVMRMDAIDLPLFYGTIKHSFKSKYKIYMQLNAASQLKADKSKEIDLQMGAKISNHFLLTTIFSYMTSSLLDKEQWMVKLEARYAF